MNNNNNDWTGEKDKILLELEGRKIFEIEKKLNSLLGNDWRFIGNPRIYVNPPISIKAIRKEEIIGILKSNNLMWLPRGF